MKKILFILTLCLCYGSTAQERITILHTNDTHSCIEPERNGNAGVLNRALLIENIADYLITKACDYDSSEFYYKAVSLIGQRNVVLRKMELGLPFNTEDHTYIANNLK